MHTRVCVREHMCASTGPECVLLEVSRLSLQPPEVAVPLPFVPCSPSLPAGLCSLPQTRTQAQHSTLFGGGLAGSSVNVGTFRQRLFPRQKLMGLGGVAVATLTPKLSHFMGRAIWDQPTNLAGLSHRT